MTDHTILVVVENILVYEALHALLGTWGYRVTEVSHYESGWSSEVSAPDLILIDVEDSDEHALLKLIGKVSEGLRAFAPMLILSNDAGGGHLRALRQSGMELYAINKPVLPDYLRKEIQTLLGPMAGFAW